MLERIKNNLADFFSRKLFFSMAIFISCCILLDRGRLQSSAFELITVSIIAAYLTSNVATKYTVSKNGFIADSYGNRNYSGNSIQGYDDNEEEMYVPEPHKVYNRPARSK